MFSRTNVMPRIPDQAPGTGKALDPGLRRGDDKEMALQEVR